jgi:hypothetical protein
MATFSSTLVFFRSDSVVLCLITEQDSPWRSCRRYCPMSLSRTSTNPENRGCVITRAWPKELKGNASCRLKYRDYLWAQSCSSRCLRVPASVVYLL